MPEPLTPKREPMAGADMSGCAGPLEKRLFSDGLLTPAANGEI